MYGCGEVSFTPTHLSYLLHKLNQAEIARQHEGIDENAAFSAAGDFFECAANDQRVKAKGVLVDSAVL